MVQFKHGITSSSQVKSGYEASSQVMKLQVRLSQVKHGSEASSQVKSG